MIMSGSINILVIIRVALSMILLSCLYDFPYGYYQLVRFISLIGFGYLSYSYYRAEKQNIAVFFIALAVLFQPFLKISLGREIWNIVDVLVAFVLVLTLFNKRFKIESK